MKPISVQCPHCQTKLKLKNPTLAGKKVKCPSCGEQFTAGSPSTQSDGSRKGNKKRTGSPSPEKKKRPQPKDHSPAKGGEEDWRDDASKPAEPVWDPRYGGATTKRSRNVVDSFGDKLAERNDKTLGRLCISCGCAVSTASMTYGLVELLQWFGIIQLETIEKSLFVRIGIPVIAAAVAFGWVWWLSGTQLEAAPKITENMTDEEIADLLREE